MISIFLLSNYFYKIYKLFLRSTILEDFLEVLLKTYKTSEDLQNLIRLYGVIFVKMSYSFLFGHKSLL